MSKSDMRDLVRGYFIVVVVLCALPVFAPTAARPAGCGAYPPPPLDAASEHKPRTVTVTADAHDASTCAQMTTDDVMWELIAAEEVGRAVRFVGCVEVVP